MAIVVPMRKKYKPRCIVEAVVDNVLRLRSNCHTMRNPNTPAQQYMRSRFKLMHNLQKGLAPLIRRGFNRQRNAQERWVGAYHIALGHNLTEAARYNHNTGLWECNFSHFAICEHRSRAPKRITMQREGHLLILSYHWQGQAERTSILWAVYNRKRAQWVQGIHDTHLRGTPTACTIPPAWSEEPLEVLIGFGRDAQGRGKLRGTHHFALKEGVMRITLRGGTPKGTSPTPSSKEVWHVVRHATLPWVEIKNPQGVVLRVKVLYLTE